MNEIEAQKIDANIFMLVHDSIVAEVKEEDVERYCEMLKRCTQKSRGVEIPGVPIGIDQDIGDDYSFGKFLEYYGEELSEFEGSEVSDIPSIDLSEVD